MTSTVRSSDGRVVIPARLRRRRAEVRRGEGRRRLRRVVAFGVLAGILAAGWALLRSPLLAVDHFVVTGSEHVDADQVVEVTGIGPGVAMMDVSPGDAETAIETLPWIAEAQVTREWPGRITVELVDREAIAQVASGDAFALVDAEGRVLQTDVPRLEGLPLLAGRHHAEAGTRIAEIEPLLRTAEALPVDHRDRVEEIAFSEGGAVALTLEGDATVSLGRSEDFGAKFASLTAVLEHIGSLGSGCTLDVSVPTAPTLTPEYGCA